MALSYKNDNQSDERLSPYEQARQLHDQEQQGAFDRDFDSIADNYDKTADPTQEDSNIDRARQAASSQEQNPDEAGNPMNYRSSGGLNSKSKVTGRFQNLRKRGPLVATIIALLGGGFGLTMLFTPGLMVIHMKEILTDSLNDQLGAADIRSTHVMRAKLRGLQPDLSLCTGAVDIRCKFSSLADKKIDRLRQAGFDIETRDSSMPRRSVISSMSFTDAAGNKIDIDNPGQLYRLAGNNPEIRRALRKGFNPKYATMADATMRKVFDRIPGLHKRQKIPATSDQTEARRAIAEASRGNSGTTERFTGGDSETDEQRRAREGINSGSSELDNRAQEVRSSGIKSVGGGAVRGVGVLGAIDSICVVKSTSQAIETGAKVTRAYQLANYAMVFLTMADAMMAGQDVSPEQAETTGNILTATDQRETIEVEKIDGSGTEERKNPYYQKNALDSNGYKLAAYGDVPNHHTGSLQYMIGGTGMLGVLSGVNQAVSTEYSNTGCKVVTNPITRIVSGAIGIGLGIFTGGATLVASIGASALVSMALPYLEGMLIDMLAGMAVDENTAGPEAGDAIFAGTAFMLGMMAQNRGMQPMSLKNSSSRTYLARTNEVKNDYIAHETMLAKSEPFNIYNQYSFLGSLSRKVAPSVYGFNYTASSALGSVSSILSTAIDQFNPVAHAAEFDEDRYKVCNDNDFNEIDINADAFCNIRYVMTNQELAMDAYENMEWMVDNGQIDPGTGDPIPDSNYADFIKNCVERFDSGRGTIVPFGVAGSDGEGTSDITNGAECVDGNSSVMTNISRFRVYTMDRSLQQAIDEEEPAPEAPQDPVQEVGVVEVNGDWAAPMQAGTYTITSGWRTTSRPNHIGVDLAAPMDTPIYAAGGGVVSFVGVKPHGTHYVTIDHGNGIQTEYGHSYPDQVLVQEGERVEAGQKIAGVGNHGGPKNVWSSRGRPTRANGFGAHLHFNYLVNGRDYNPVIKLEEHGISI